LLAVEQKLDIVATYNRRIGVSCYGGEKRGLAEDYSRDSFDVGNRGATKREEKQRERQYSE
jgi:hypothetical protein